ncbi:MAG: hypothetical protein ALECFALPRED_003436 [Alectoria fallacina]|uniref:Uncharacterized protein n=1 Tax=Alectoria fallacina TaxID=1903189 RepID=A0A8H3IMI0_9LECA|nr:MAG: hypothetical protein ALECFALPRED_003436 [Alectoria fallacina]
MGLKLRTEDGAYGSAASTASSVSGRSQIFSESASQNAEFSDSEEDISIAQDLTQTCRNQALYETGNGVPQSSFVTQLDPDVEALIRRINENVVIRDKAPKSPHSILVPKGYLVDNEIKPSRFYETRSEVRDHVKKRKREGVLPPQSKKQWRNERHGFRAQEVNRNGAVHLEGCKSSNLTNDIHPLFDRSNFDDTPDAIYDQLIPGLQLASMFLTQKICMQFWVTLALGDRRDDAEMTSRNGKLSQRIDNHVELTEERARTVIEHINSIGKSSLIHFRFKHKLEGAWGTSAPICEYQGIERDYHGLKGDLVRSIIRIHADYYIIAKKLSQLKYHEVSQKLRFNFLFAVLIIHELAHSIEGIHMKNRAEQWVDWHTSRYYKEVYWLDWQESECGRAWEETIFGCHVAPINNRVDGSHGISVSDWPPRGTENDPHRRIWSTISMRYIEKLFQMSTWQRSFSLQDWHVFNIPRDGATSLYINSFTTMSETEEQRVAREELAEAIALTNAQPAKKKRVKATGKMEEQRPKDEKVIEEAVIEREQQPESPIRQISTFHGLRRASSPGALAGQRLILAPHTRRPDSGLTTVPERPSLQPVPPLKAAQAPLMSTQLKAVDELTEIYPKHGESLTGEVPKEPTFGIIKRLKTQPTGLMDAFRHRRRLGLAKKQTEAKRKRNFADNKILELQHSLMRETELKKELAAARNELKTVKENADAERQQALANKAEVEARERQRRKNRLM